DCCRPSAWRRIASTTMMRVKLVIIRISAGRMVSRPITSRSCSDRLSGSPPAPDIVLNARSSATGTAAGAAAAAWANAACGHARRASAPIEKTRFILLGILERARRRFGQSGQSAARGGHENFPTMEFDHREAHRRREHGRFDDPHGAAAALRQAELTLQAL